MKFDFYDAAPKERVTCCNLCGHAGIDTVKLRDRYRLPVVLGTCRRCGLTFLAERMTPAAYAEFYRDGHYRQLLTAYRNEVVSAISIEEDQKRYAKRLSACLAPHMDPYRSGLLLDVGGSTGVVAERMAYDFNLDATVIEPSAAEAARARARGLAVAQVPAEEYDNGGIHYDVALLCRSVDHLMDLMGTLRRIRAWLRPGGLFWVDICGRGDIKIDHPYYLTPRTLQKALHRARFRAKAKVWVNGRAGSRMGFIAEAA